MADHPVEVDIIFVGGGTSACVAAGRLAAANPDLNIMLIEQGPNNFKEPSVYTPAFFLGHLAPDSKTALFWKTNKSEFLNGRESVIATGGLLGGGSSINFMMYNRPSASDFDDWKTPGWGSKDLLPLLQKLENYHVAPGRTETHGYNGPINVSYADYYAKIADEYLDVCMKRGIPFAEDIMDLNTGHGCQRLAKYIDPVTGRRQDAAHCYIHTQSSNKRLHVVTQTLVSRILFDGTKAVGVEVIGNKNQVADADQTPRKILARKLVVVSAGAIGSAIVLQRSGVGEAARSSELGVGVVSDVPVGSNYEDHSSCLITYHAADENETMDIVMEQDPKVMEKYIAQYANGKGLLTTNGNDAGAKLRPTPEELKDMGPAFQDYWKRYFEPAPDKPVFVQTIINGFLGPRSVVEGHGSRFMMIGNIAAYPASRGSVYATSTDPYAPPNFRSGILDEQADVDAHIWMYKKSREILRRLPSYRGEFAPLHPKFPTGSPAACVRLHAPLSADVEDHVYTPEDDAAIEQFVRDRSDTTWHSIGTVQMKPKEKGGCVDDRLNIYGTSNLKVADLSILPGNVGANTYATSIMVGEKAALLIAEDLGVKLP